MIYKELVTESFAVTDMTAVTSTILFRSESKGSSFHNDGRPYGNHIFCIFHGSFEENF